jgi:hypothetical protein
MAAVRGAMLGGANYVRTKKVKWQPVKVSLRPATTNLDKDLLPAYRLETQPDKEIRSRSAN